MPTIVNLSDLGSRGFTLQGDDSNDQAGFSVSDAGDVNGDGFDDFLVSAPQTEGWGQYTGRTYVIFGGPSQPSVFDLGSFQDDEGFFIQGAESNDFAGLAVSGAGDINGDGFDDLIVAALGDYGGWYYANGSSEAYVIFGSQSPHTIDLSALSASDGFLLSDEESGSYYSWFSVSDAGDVNGDGFDDLIIGSGVDGTPGAAYVIFGRAGGFGAIDLNNIAPDVGFEIVELPGDYGGTSVSAAGDVNGDGYDDVIVGRSQNDSGGSQAGQAYVIFGRASGFGTVNLVTLAPPNGFIIRGDTTGDLTGISVSSAGDVNNDGFDDLLIGAMGGDDGGTNAGQAYVIFGRASGFGTIDLTDLGTNGFMIQGDATEDSAGRSVSAAGDVNGDGYADIIIGAPYGDNGGLNAGEAYVIYGRSSDFATIDLANLNPSQGFVIQGGAAGDTAGFSVSAAGDVNGDGVDDMIVGAPQGDLAGIASGQAYVVFGQALSANNRNVAGDFNGDGRDDILWRHDSGTMINWLGQANGGFVSNANASAGTDWNVVGLADFNGDGRDDVLWRNVDGSVTNWLGQADGTFLSNFGNAYYAVGATWTVAGTGDFNGDGRGDVLWRDASGRVTNWVGQANGGFTPNLANSDSTAGTDWHIVGTGDFNGDGRDDILWRNNDGSVTNWLGQTNGNFASNFGSAYYQVTTDWTFVGTGDFNGDGRDDVLWRNANGQVSNWLGQANGGFSPNAHANAGTDWNIVSIGDFNGDGRDDVLWRNDDGTLTNWLGQANGSFASNFENAYYHVSSGWDLQPASDYLV